MNEEKQLNKIEINDDLYNAIHKISDIFNSKLADIDSNLKVKSFEFKSESSLNEEINSKMNNIKDIYFVDSGYNHVFDSNYLKVIFFKVGYSKLNEKKTVDQKIDNYFVILTKKEDKFNFDVFKVLNYSSYNFDIQKLDFFLNGNNFNLNNLKLDFLNHELLKDLEKNIIIDSLRRYFELNLVLKLIEMNRLRCDFTVVLDGLLDSYYDFEKPILEKILKYDCVFGFSKKTIFSSNLDTVSFIDITDKLSLKTDLLKSIVVKLSEKSNYIFRIDYNSCLDPYFIYLFFNKLSDNIFIGYPYGLILIDRLCKVSESEKKLINLVLFQNCTDKRLFNLYSNESNSHDFIDAINFSKNIK